MRRNISRYAYVCFCFFFSSRRRHTRCSRDWSSDVCSSDLFVRYADDCNVYVRSERAGHRVMESISRFITQKLKLKVNEAKSAVARPQERKFLGFSFTAGPDIKRMIAPKSLERDRKSVV